MRSAGLAFAVVVLAACSTDPASGGAAAGTSNATGAPGPTEPGASTGADGGASSHTPWSTEAKTGIATYYDADGTGNCSFDASPQDLDVVALALSTDYAGSAMCGGCLEVTGAKGTVVVRVVDSCPGCEAGHVDLSREAFGKIDDLPKGRVPISFRFVECSVTGSMSYRFKDGSSKYWTAIQVRNHKVPVAKLEFQKAGAFVEMKRETYDYFVASAGVGDQPSGLTLRVTSIDGQVVTDHVDAIGDGVTKPGTAQFE